jgi:hypothetical protein
VALAAVDPKELCAWYRRNKKWIELAISILGKFPVPAPLIDALRTLIIIADRLCPA